MAENPSSAVTIVPPESGPQVVVAGTYEAVVRKTLIDLGANDPDGLLRASGDFWLRCQAAGVDAKVTAATIYGAERHRHEVARTVLQEAAAEAPTREEWEVIVRRTGSMDDITTAAGRKADEVIGNHITFGDFYDDEKAAAFAKRMTKAGFIATYGPRRLEAAAENTASEKAALRWVEVWFHFPADAAKFAKALEKKHSTVVALAMNRIVRTNASRGDIEKVLTRHQWEGEYTLYPERREAAEGAPSAMPSASEVAPVIHEDAEEDGVVSVSRLSATEKNKILAVLGPNSGIASVLKYGPIYQHAVVISMMPKGVATLDWKTNGREAEINVFVAPKYRRKGVGSVLVAKAKKYAATKGLTVVAPGGSNESSARAVKFYERNGVSIISREIREPGAEPGSIPWRKVERDPKAHEADMKLAERYGAIRTPEKVYEVVGEALSKEDSETFLVLPLNVRGELKSAPYEVARGQRSRVVVDPSDVLRAALHAGAEGYIVVHNHPSGRCKPSKADLDLTETLKAATKPYGKSLCLVDHVVVGHAEVYSIMAKKLYKVKP